ncbi:MAG: prephenate dehydrogenase [Candidatus Izemoplasmatales bacterium]
MKIGIVGLGLMGGSIALSLNQNNEIIAFDINSDALSYAKTNKIIQEGTLNLELFFHNTKVVFICLYPHSIKEFLIKANPYIEPGTIIVEISGVKSALISELEQVQMPHYELVYTHPIAGREKKGVEFANPSIFLKANFVIVPVSRNTKETLAVVEMLATTMGFKNISYLSPLEHDNIIAYTSQLTHVISLALVNSESNAFDTSKFIGDSYRDLTRISMINEGLWSELFLSNKEFLLEKIEAFENYLDQYKNAMLTENREELKRLMVDSREKRLKIEKKNNS